MTQFYGNFCDFIRKAGTIDRLVSKNDRVGMLSNEFKIISALLSEDGCVIKDLPFMTGLPNRTVYNVVAKLHQQGIIIKSRKLSDMRFSCVEISLPNLKRIFCDKFQMGSEYPSGCCMQGLEK